jgi:hypothetical protein
MSTPWEIGHSSYEDITILQPLGDLTTATAPSLREVLVKHAVEQPRGLVVDLRRLTPEQERMLSVISVVWSRTQLWPGTPLAAVLPNPSHRVQVVLRAVPMYSTVEEALANIEEPPSRLRVHTDLPAALASAGAARRFVTQTCARWPVTLDEETLDAAVLIANELVENTVRHTPVPELRLRLEWTGGWLHVAVADQSLHQAVLREPRGIRDTFRGLRLVSELSHTWGCSPQLGGGKVVWATLALDRPTRPSTPSGSRTP